MLTKPENNDWVGLCFDAFGIDPRNMMVSRSGRHQRWYPRSEFHAPLRSGIHFDADRSKLLIFDTDEITVLRGGDRPAAWRKTPELPEWRGFRPRPFSLRRKSTPGKRPAGNRRESAWKHFAGTFPDSVAEAVWIAPADTAWGVLQCITRIQGAADIFQDNPAVMTLAYWHFMFNRKRSTGRPFEVTRRLLRGKQREILARTGFDRADRRIFRKIPASAASVYALFTLRTVLRENRELRNCLRHLRGSIDRNVLPLFAAPACRYLTSELVEEVAAAGRRVVSLAMLSDVHRMRTALGLQPLRYRSVKAVFRAHEDLVGRMNTIRLQDRYGSLVFPAPPLPGIETQVSDSDLRIRPFTDPRILIDHGRRQHNCVACYATQVARGECYIYGVEPARGIPHTVSIQPNSQTGLWQLAEIKARYNSAPQADIRQSVLQWLGRMQNRPGTDNDLVAASDDNHGLFEDYPAAAEVDETHPPF